MKRNNCLNLLKFVACFGVVFIHVPFPGIFGEIIKYLSGFSVPLFFMISGYYSYGCDYKKIKSKLIKILKILLFTYILYLFYNIIMSIKNSDFPGWLIRYYNFHNIILSIVFCTIWWAIPLWYLIAMSEVYLVWMIVVKKGLQSKFTSFTFVLLLLELILTIYVDSVGINWYYKTNFICRAMSWFMLGYLIKEKYENKLDKISNIKLLCVVFLGSFIILSFIFFKPTINYSCLGLLFISPALFLIGIKNPDIKINKFIEFIGDKLSMYIYIFHLIISWLIISRIKLFGINIDGIYSYIHPIFTLIATILISSIFYFILKKRK